MAWRRVFLVTPAAHTTLKRDRAVLLSKDRLRSYMTDRKVSVRGLADLAGFKHHSFLQQLRDGSRSGCRVATAEAIATALKVEPGVLFQFEQPSP